MARKSESRTKAANVPIDRGGADATASSALSDAIVRDSHRQVLGYFRRRLSNANDAEDLAQETMLRMVRTLPSLRTRDRLQPWIFRIARGVLADYWKAKLRTAESALDVEALPVTDSATANAEKELVGCLELFTGRLPERYREAVELSEYGELPHREIAKRLGLSVSGVKSRVQRGREQLKLLVLECCAVDLYGGEVRSVEPRTTRTNAEPFGCGARAVSERDGVRGETAPIRWA